MNSSGVPSCACDGHRVFADAIDVSGHDDPAAAADEHPGASPGEPARGPDPGEPAAREHLRHADHLFLGRIVTMDEAQPEAAAVAIRRGKVIGVGPAAGLEPLTGPFTRRIQLGDRVMYPGFIEPHMHVWATAVTYRWIDCSPRANGSAEDVLATIAAAAAKAGSGSWILGASFDPSLLKGFPELSRRELDAAAPANPVLILNASMHFAYVNSAALERAGISDTAADPPGGHYGRDGTGTLTGVLGEMGAIAPALRHIGRITPMMIMRNIHAITRDAAAAGVTAMREGATGALIGPREVELLHALRRLGWLKCRLSLAVVDDLAAGWTSPEIRPGAGDDMVWLGARKIIADGSNQGRSGYLKQPYLGTGGRGAANLSRDQLAERIRWCEDHGWQLMVHANGDAAIEMVIGAYEQALSGRPRKDLRHRIEHCSLAGDGMFERMAAAGVTPSFLMNHVYYWGQTLRDNFLGRGRSGLLDRAASARAAGLRFSLHSDYNVSPISPLQLVMVAATRQMRDGGTLNEAEKVSVYQALRAVTIDAAWHIHADDVMGSIAVGKHADFAILDDDPQQVPAGQIAEIRVLETWLGGKPSFRARPG